MVERKGNTMAGILITSENCKEVEEVINKELKRQREQDDYGTSMVMFNEGYILAESCKVTCDGLYEVDFYIGELHIRSVLTTEDNSTLTCWITEGKDNEIEFSIAPPPL